MSNEEEVRKYENRSEESKIRGVCTHTQSNGVAAVPDAKNIKLRDPKYQSLYGQTGVATFAPNAATLGLAQNSSDYRYGKTTDADTTKYQADMTYKGIVYTTDSGKEVSLATLKNDYDLKFRSRKMA